MGCDSGGQGDERAGLLSWSPTHHTTPLTPLVGRVTRLIAVSLALVAAVLVAPGPSVAAETNPIVVENTRQGTSAWRITRPGDALAKQIKGYADRSSVAQGETIRFHVSVNTAQTFSIDFYRMGYYGGQGARLVGSSGTLNGSPQSYPPLDTNTGFVEYSWPISYQLTPTTDWVSGVYLAKLTNAQGFQNYIPFVVSDDRRADVLFQRPTLTEAAYNNFPAVDPSTPGYNPNNPAHVGKSVYDYNSYGPNTLTGTTRAVKVSLNRPFDGIGDGLFLNWEYDLLVWMEKEGYDITYTTNEKVHADPASLRPHKVFVSPGHDEYWTSEMFSAAEAARDGGVGLGFFGANSAYNQVRLEPSGSGTPNRTLVVYKQANLDPIADPSLKTVRFREVSRAEQTLVGVQYIDFNSFSNSDFRPINTDHWIYSGSGLSTSSAVNDIVGYEVDGFDPAYPAPVGPQTLLGDSPFLASSGATVRSNASIYQAPSGAWVFGSGTMSWSWALSRSGYVDNGIQTMTRNLMAAFLTGSGGGGGGGGGSCGPLTQEAENGTINGNRIVVGNDTNASGGQYIHLPDGSGNYWNGPDDNARIDYCFDVTTPGTYRIAGNVHTLTNYSDSFYLTADGTPTTGHLWDVRVNQSYLTDHLNDRNTGTDPVELDLTAGQHTISVHGREDGTRLDTISLELITPTPDGGGGGGGGGGSCGPLTQEAENATLSGNFVVRNSAGASGGSYIVAPEGTGSLWNGPDETHKAEFCFTVSSPGRYNIEGLVRGTGPQSDSFYVKVDGGPPAGYTWFTYVTSSLRPLLVTDYPSNDTVSVNLSSGDHTVTIYVREDGTWLDVLRLVPA